MSKIKINDPNGFLKEDLYISNTMCEFTNYIINNTDYDKAYKNVAYNSNPKLFLKFIKLSPEGTIFKLSKAKHKEIIIDCLINKILVPVYKLDHDNIKGNKWIEELSTLNREFRTKDGETFNGSKPENIKVAFKRSAIKY